MRFLGGMTAKEPSDAGLDDMVVAVRCELDLYQVIQIMI